MFSDSSQKNYDSRKNYHIHCVTGRATEELEVYFLERYLLAILTQGRFLVAITNEHFIPSTNAPEIIFVNCVQKIKNDCVPCILKNIECYIDKINELTSGYRSRNFNVGIRRWFDTEDDTDLRALIVNLLLD